VAGHVSLIVKGPLKNAKRAAQRRGVHLESCRIVGSKFGDVQCFAKCTTSANRNIVEWFSDRARTKAGRGYPPGTLLYHGSLCEMDFGRSKRKRRR
jgi:hypothetical protein